MVSEMVVPRKPQVRGGGGYPFCFSLLKYEKVNGKINKI